MSSMSTRSTLGRGASADSLNEVDMWVRSETLIRSPVPWARPPERLSLDAPTGRVALAVNQVPVWPLQRFHHHAPFAVRGCGKPSEVRQRGGDVYLSHLPL